jgi:hypothetical protein
VLFVRDRPIGAYLVFVDIPHITPIALAFSHAWNDGKKQRFGSLVENIRRFSITGAVVAGLIFTA